ncbi:Transmembrane protein [Trema orientale]|uniref:Transmembrane protein n=1 Tax=Trema orientale TaxID=63057 RepID=A0A2P5FMD5_TREOI|nr:Transmembrane protein [Trema orientale]
MATFQPQQQQPQPQPQPQQQQPVLVYPVTNQPQPESGHHPNGSFGTVFIVLAVIIVISGIACCLGRLCHRRAHHQKPKKSQKSRPKEGDLEARNRKFQPKEGDIEFGNPHLQPKGDVEFGKSSFGPKEGYVEFGNRSFRPSSKEGDVEFGFDKRNPNSGRPNMNRESSRGHKPYEHGDVKQYHGGDSGGPMANE